MAGPVIGAGVSCERCGRVVNDGARDVWPYALVYTVDAPKAAECESEWVCAACLTDDELAGFERDWRGSNVPGLLAALRAARKMGKEITC